MLTKEIHGFGRRLPHFNFKQGTFIFLTIGRSGRSNNTHQDLMLKRIILVYLFQREIGKSSY